MKSADNTFDKYRLPETRKGQSGNILHCPQRDYHATSVANFCTAVLKRFSAAIAPLRDEVGFVMQDRRALIGHGTDAVELARTGVQ